MGINIEKVRIRNFRSLRDIEVHLAPITLLVGANNAGKTTFLKALNSVFGIAKNQINRDDLFIDKDGNTPDTTITIDLKIIPVDDAGRRELAFSDQWQSKLGGANNISTEVKGAFFAVRAAYTFGVADMPEVTYTLFTDWNSEILRSTDFKGISQIRNNLKLYFIDAQRDILEDAAQRTSFFGRLVSQLDYGQHLEGIKQQINDLNAAAIANSPVLEHLQTKLSKLNETTQTQGTGVTLTPFPKNIRDLHKGMKVYFQDKDTDAFSMEYHGMGTRSWASIITAGAYTAWEIEQIQQKIDAGETDTDLLFPVFALEEPEAHLHPNAQRTLYQQLKAFGKLEITAPDGQVTKIFGGQTIISTHSPYIAGQAELTEIRHFYKDGDSTVVSAIDTDLTPEMVSKIRREVIDSRGEILFSRAVVLFEGQTEKQCLPIFFEKQFDKQPFQLGIFFVEVNGNNYKPFIKLAQMLNIPWFIFSDYDNQNIRRGVDNALSEIGIHADEHVVKLGVSIEKYLVDSGYQEELKRGINAYFLLTTDASTSQLQIDAKQQQVNNFDDTELLSRISSGDGKVRYPTYWAKAITQRTDDSYIPLKIRELFDSIATTLSLNQPSV